VEFYFSREVSSADARKVARHFDAAFFEVSAAEESAPVRRIFLEAARAIVRELERCVPLRSLYWDEHSGEQPKDTNFFPKFSLFM